MKVSQLKIIDNTYALPPSPQFLKGLSASVVQEGMLEAMHLYQKKGEEDTWYVRRGRGRASMLLAHPNTIAKWLETAKGKEYTENYDTDGQTPEDIPYTWYETCDPPTAQELLAEHTHNLQHRTPSVADRAFSFDAFAGAGVTQKELASKLGCSQPFVSNLAKVRAVKPLWDALLAGAELEPLLRLAKMPESEGKDAAVDAFLSDLAKGEGKKGKKEGTGEGKKGKKEGGGKTPQEKAKEKECAAYALIRPSIIECLGAPWNGGVSALDSRFRYEAPAS